MSIGEAGRESARLLLPVVGAMIATPVVAGYIALGTAVLVGRGALGVVGAGWRRVASVRRRRTPRAEIA